MDSGDLWKSFLQQSSGGGACVASQRGEAASEGFKHSRPQREEVKLAIAPDGNQAGRFKFLDVMGECGGGDGKSGAGFRAAKRTAGLGDPLQQFKPPRIGESFEDGGAAGAGEAR